MKVLIIDDESKARSLLEIIISDKCDEITEIYKAEDLESGVEMIKKMSPEIVFLDIEMPKYSGLQILEFFETKEVNFQIIFTTAYHQYAINAFKLAAIDYLLKPINVLELQEAVSKAVALIKKQKFSNKLDDLKSTFQKLSLNKIALEIPKGILFASYDDIKFFEADGMYTNVYLKDNKVELICKPIKFFADQLEKNTLFYKPHRSYLINLKHVKQLIKQDGTYLLMNNNKTIPVSKDKKEEFITLVNEVFNL
jgi:two-component system LytT family response regulator